MSVRNQLKLLVGGLNQARRGSRPPGTIAPSAMSEFLERSPLVAALIFLVTVAAIVLISSAGVTTYSLLQPSHLISRGWLSRIMSATSERGNEASEARSRYCKQWHPKATCDSEVIVKGIP